MALAGAAGVDTADATSASAAAQDFAEQLLPASALDSSPLRGRRVGLLKQLTGSGVDPAVNDAFQAACRHLEALGALVEEVRNDNEVSWEIGTNTSTCPSKHVSVLPLSPDSVSDFRQHAM